MIYVKFYLFILIINEITNHLQDNILFAYDIILVIDESLNKLILNLNCEGNLYKLNILY